MTQYKPSLYLNSLNFWPFTWKIQKPKHTIFCSPNLSWIDDRLVYLNIFPLWWSDPFPASRLSQFLWFSWFLLIWQWSCNFFARTFFTYRLRQVMRNIKRTIFYIECTLLKRPPSGRKVSSTIKSASPRIFNGDETSIYGEAHLDTVDSISYRE